MCTAHPFVAVGTCDCSAYVVACYFSVRRHGKEASEVVKLLLKFHADPAARVGATSQTLLDFAEESAADPNYVVLLKVRVSRFRRLGFA